MHTLKPMLGNATTEIVGVCDITPTPKCNRFWRRFLSISFKLMYSMPTGLRLCFIKCSPLPPKKSYPNCLLQDITCNSIEIVV